MTTHRMATWLLHGQRAELGLLDDLGDALAAVSWSRVALSRSEANCAKAASSRYCARSSLSGPATFFMAFVCAAEPTRETEMPTLSAGRWPALKRSDSR